MMKTPKGRGFGKDRGTFRHKIYKRVRVVGTWSKKL
jgi:hypothetical protein